MAAPGGRSAVDELTVGGDFLANVVGVALEHRSRRRMAFWVCGFQWEKL